MKVTLLDHTANPVEKIGHMAAICYDADTSPAPNCAAPRSSRNAKQPKINHSNAAA